MTNNDSKCDFPTNQKVRMLSAIREIIFREKMNFDAITVVNICKKAGVSRRNFYRYYKDKYDIMYDMVTTDLDGFDKIINDIIIKPVKPVQKLKLIQEQLLKTFSEDFTQDVIDHFRYQAPQFYEINIRRYNDIIKNISKIVEEGIQNGDFKNNIDSHMVTFLLFCSTDSDISQKYMPESNCTQSMIVEHAFNIILNGILKED